MSASQQRAALDPVVVQTKMIAKGAASGEVITCWEEVQVALKGAGLAWRTRPRRNSSLSIRRIGARAMIRNGVVYIYGLLLLLCLLRCSDEIDLFLYCACRSKLGSTAIAADFHGAKNLKGGFLRAQIPHGCSQNLGELGRW